MISEDLLTHAPLFNRCASFKQGMMLIILKRSPPLKLRNAAFTGLPAGEYPSTKMVAR